MAENSFVAKCNCVSEFQDKTYGKGNRVFNNGLKGGHCTVCGTTSSAPKKETKAVN
jgi:hypothetical protein